MKYVNLLVTALIPLVFAGCEFAGIEEQGVYTYTAYDSTGTPVVTGTLNLEFIEPQAESEYQYKIDGHWDFRKVEDNAEKVGPQVGKGQLSGSVDEDGNFWIDLNPGWVDNNVILRGEIENGEFRSIEGDWIYATFAGGANRGRFEAEKTFGYLLAPAPMSLHF